MTVTTIGVLHPGEMGAAAGGCLAARGHRVLWASRGRGRASADRAAAAGLVDVTDVGPLAREADVILSICPPHAAPAVARAVAGFRGLYVDANAVSPATTREIARIMTDGGADFVDGGIIGPPPAAGSGSRLYLSGARAAQVAGLFAGTALEATAIGTEPGPASALKLAYAAWTKGTAALILAVRALARAESVDEHLLAEWQLSQPALEARSSSAAASAARKGWRWVGEMEEIAAAMAAAGLPAGFHRAAAEVFRRSPPAGPGGNDPELATLLTALLAAPDPRRGPAAG